MWTDGPAIDFTLRKSRRLQLCGLVGLAADDSKLYPRVTYFSHTRGRKRLNIFITIKQGNPKSLKFNYWLSKNMISLSLRAYLEGALRV